MYPTHTCYQYRDKWYRRLNLQRSQSHGESHCQSLNGTLAPIRSPDHLRFLSAISSPDKTWIGGQRVVGSDPIQFRFADPDVSPIDQYNPGWAFNQPGDLRQACIVIDRRSTMGNLESMACDNDFDFICEFSNANECEGDSLEVTDDNGSLRTFTMPYPPECPEMERAINITQHLPEAEDLKSNDVICEFGAPVFHEELYCCVDCFNHSFLLSNGSIRPSSCIPILLLTLLTLWLIF